MSETAICVGSSFGIYVLRELIGLGNTASVYRAHDTRLLREVAIKVLNTEALAGADGLARFLHEARMAAAIRHPNVVSMFDVGAHDGTPYIVMELLTGEDLDVRLNAARVLRGDGLIDMAVQLASGLAAVHDAGVVHRDVRPGNVFLARGPDGSTQPKLIDFGGSKQTRDSRRLTTNGRRRFAAMPLYTAPEVLLEGDATFLSDQYSLGVLLYECATGVHPFRADTVRESVELITSGQARRIAEQPLQPSRRLAAVIERAMHFDPAERFADMRELGRALDSARKGRWPWSSSPDPVLARATPPARGPKERQAAIDPGQTSGRGLSWAIAATVIACSIGAPVWAWWSVRRPRTPAPISVAAPLAPSEAPVAAQPPVCAVAPAPASAPASTSGAPAELAASGTPAPASAGQGATAEPVPALATASVAAQPAELALASEAQPTTLVAAAPHALEPVAPPLPAELAAGGEGEGTPGGEAASPAEFAPALGGSSVDPGVAPAPDAGVDPNDPLGASLPRLAAPTPAHERGTNGALIFD